MAYSLWWKFKFLFAVQDDNLHLIRDMLYRQSLLDREFQEDFLLGMQVSSPVFVAVKAGFLEVVRELIIYIKNNVRESAYDRIIPANPDEFHIEITSGKSYWFQELVQWAARWGHVSIVEFLVAEYECLKRNIMGLPFHLAAFHGHLNVLNMLASQFQHTIVSPQIFGGLLAIHLAAQSGFVDVIELLLKHAPLQTDPEFLTAMHIAANSGHVEVVNYLLAIPNLIMKRDCLGRTALHYAAREGHVHVVQALVEAEQEIALLPDYDGLLALHMAARAGHVEVIIALNPFGGIMCQAKNSLAVKSWVEREYAQEYTRDHYSLTFLPGKKWKFPRVNLFDSLFWRTKGFTPLHFAARYGYGEAVKELLNNRDADGCNALFLQDRGRFLAYDWMKVQGQGDIFVASCVAGGCNLDVIVDELEKRSFIMSNKITSDMSRTIALNIDGERQAIKELQQAWQRGIDISIEAAINRFPVCLWFLEDEDIVCAPWQYELASSSAVLKTYWFWALDRALERANFTAAKHLLLHYPRADLTLDAARVFTRVKETLSKQKNQALSDSPLEDFLIALMTREELALATTRLRWLAQWAIDKNITSFLEMIIDRPELKRGLYEDRQLYVDCANAMLVGAALIAGVAFQGWLQPPLAYTYAYEGSEYMNVHQSSTRAFYRFNNGSFFFAVASLIAGAKGAVPVQHTTDVLSSLAKVKRAVGVASFFLAMALVCVVGAFTAAGFAILPPLNSDLHIMRSDARWGTTLCALVLLWFALGVFPLVTQTIPYMALRLKDFLLFCVFIIPFTFVHIVFLVVKIHYTDENFYIKVKWVDNKCFVLFIDPLLKRMAHLWGTGAFRNPPSV